MKNLNILNPGVLFLFIAVQLSCSIFAQQQIGPKGQNGPPPIPNQKQIKEMVANLSGEILLTQEQESTILNLYSEHFEEVKTKTSGSAMPKREEMEALKTNFEKSVKELLTDSQKKKYNAYLKKNEQRQPPGELLN